MWVDRFRWQGSSPLARGAPVRVRWAVHSTGIIPARAGSTPRSSPPGCSPRDHPRSRGEHVSCWSGLAWVSGSSPLARGARSTAAPGRAGDRIIPARAGSTSRRRPRFPRGRDHPRSRGEHAEPGREPGLDRGSSPLARGAPTTRTCVSSDRWDHPRSRGEHSTAPWFGSYGTGSSPLARGAHLLTRHLTNADGTVPSVRVGKLNEGTAAICANAQPC